MTTYQIREKFTTLVTLEANSPEEGEADQEGDGKNPAAVALGRLGASKGGKARADKLSAKQRSEIARKAAPAKVTPNE